MNNIKSRIINNGLFSLFFSTFIIKVIVSLGGLILSLTIGNIYNSSILGEYFIFQLTVMTFASILSLGMNETLVLFVSRYREQLNIKIYLYYTIMISLSLALVGLTSVKFISYYVNIPPNFGIIAENWSLFIISTISSIFNLLMSGFMKGVKKPGAAVLLENGAISIVCTFFILIDWYFIYELPIVLLYTISSTLISIIGFYNIYRQHSIEDKITVSGIKEFLKSNNYFYVMVICGLLSSYLVSLYIAYLFEPKDVAYFRVIQQVCVLITFSLIVINAVVPAQISSMFKEKNIDDIESLSRTTSKYGTALSLPIFIICAIFQNEIIELFSKDIIVNDYSLLVLALAQLFNVSTGSVASILKMCGYEKALSMIVLFSNIILILLLFSLSPSYGVFGAVTAVSIYICIQNALSIYFVITKLGMSPVFYIRKLNEN